MFVFWLSTNSFSSCTVLLSDFSCLIPKHELAKEFSVCMRYICDINLCRKFSPPGRVFSDCQMFSNFRAFFSNSHSRRCFYLLKSISKTSEFTTHLLLSFCTNQSLLLGMHKKKKKTSGLRSNEQ